MSVAYRAVGWNRQKRRYDAVVLTAGVTMLAAMAGGGAAMNPNATIETLLIRAFAVTAFVLLHVVLSIGPLCRLDRRFLPLLYNRRHLGVTMFSCALAHGVFAIVQFHALGDRNPLVSVLTTSASYTTVSGFPFQVLGLGGLVILFLMAATSHDFWLHNLTAPVWKALHMGVYLAYALIVGHVALGALQSERSPWLAVLVFAGVTWVLGLHVAAALKEGSRDRQSAARPDTGRGDPQLVDVCAVSEIPDSRAVVRCVSGERVAVFRYGKRCRRFPTSASTRTGRSGKDGSSTAAWSAASPAAPRLLWRRPSSYSGSCRRRASSSASSASGQVNFVAIRIRRSRHRADGSGWPDRASLVRTRCSWTCLTGRWR